MPRGRLSWWWTLPRHPEPYRPPCRTYDGSGGFTLLELLLVVTVLSAVAWMALGVVDNDSNQVRFDDTRNRLTAIRKAIIGDTSRTVNGQPEVRGYVADMGGLPDNLQSLVSQNYCLNQPEITVQADCPVDNWVTQAARAYNSDTGLWSGWNGPYLPVEAMTARNGSRFLDGWGNDDGSGNFGWIFGPVTTPLVNRNRVDLVVQSLGADGLSDTEPGAGAGLYELDYPPTTAPPLISDNEYRIMITDSGTTAQGDGSGGLRVDFGAPASCWGGGQCSDPAYTTKAACLEASATWIWRSGTCSDSTYTNVTECEANNKIWTRSRPRPHVTNADDCTGDDGGYWQPNQKLCMAITVISKGALVLLDSDTVSITWNGDGKIERFVFEDATGPTYEEDTYLFQGRMAWGVFEVDDSTTEPPVSVCNTNKPFPAGLAPWKIFTYVPGTTLVPFERPINSE